MNKEDALKKTVDQVMSELETSPQGLTTPEAQSRLEHFGLNVYKNKVKNRTLKLVLKQFRSSLVYLLLAASIISFSIKDFNDGVVIAVILLINTGLGFYQEYKSERAIENLERLVDKECLVMRDGRSVLLAEKLLVIGDIVIVREGDVAPADIKLLTADNLSVDESQLTGESLPVNKEATSEACLIFAGSTIERGEGRGVVYATASNTELGQIAYLSSTTKRVTQFEQSLTSFSSFLVRVTFLTLSAIFILKLIIDHSHTDISSLALFVIALSIAVVPEAMPVIIAVTLSRGAINLAKKHVITKTLTAVEDLGNINVLCSDKTGTLTESKLSIKKITATDNELFETLAIASLESLDEKRLKFQSPFDKAFLDYIPEDIKKKADNYKRLKELPFDPAARRRRIVARYEDKTYLIEIGSLETLLHLTNPENKEEYLKVDKADGRQGLRHLAIAYKEVDYSSADFDILKHEDGLSFVGFCSLEDPLRKSAKGTIKLAEDLGLQIKILSGDSREVTQYVAKEVGLIDKNEVVYTGDEIEEMSDTKLSEVLTTSHAFARLSPEQKYRIIRLLKLHGNVVGYQGDGINDAPALKLADVAIAVNNATDVARDSADIILLRSDIGVVVNGIRYGRGIFANINKYIRYTFVNGWGTFFALSVLYLLSVVSLPILPVQLLLTNLLTDLPCVTIATDNVDTKEMHRPSKFNVHSLMLISVVLGLITALFEVMYFAIIKTYSSGVAATGLYLFLTFTALIVIFSIRNKERFWLAPKMSKEMKIAFSVITVLSISLVYVPITKRLLSFSNFSLKLFAITILMTAIFFIVMDIVKVWFYKSDIGKNL